MTLDAVIEALVRLRTAHPEYGPCPCLVNTSGKDGAIREVREVYPGWEIDADDTCTVIECQ